MIAKVIVHAPTREEAVRRMAAVLARTIVLGVTTNQKFLISIMDNPRFQLGTFDTNFILVEHARLFSAISLAQIQGSVVAATLLDWVVQKSRRVHLRNIALNWRNVKWRTPSKSFIVNNEVQVEVKYSYKGEVQPERHGFQCDVAFKVDDKSKKGDDSKDEALPLSVVLYNAQFGQEVPGPRGIQGCAGLLRCSIGK